MQNDTVQVNKRDLPDPYTGQGEIDDALHELNYFYRKSPVRFTFKLAAVLRKVSNVRILSWQDKTTGEVYTMPPLPRIPPKDTKGGVRNVR